jgi:hypothetical protein
MFDQHFLTTKEAAAFLKVSKRMLENRRLTGEPPRYRKLGSRVVYCLTDLMEWVEAGTRTSTSDPGPGQAV